MTSLTRNLPRIISEPAIAIIGKKCYSSLVEDLNLGDVECLTLSFSKVLGIGIVAGGSIVKVPQVLLITKSGSAKGLSLPAYILETLGYAFSLAYSARNGFPFSTYGENFFLTIQNLVVTLLIVYYAPLASPQSHAIRANNNSGVFLASLISVIVAGALVVVPSTLLSLLQIATLPISLFSKIPQIVQNARDGSTGQLSTVAVASQIIGCLARLFTTATEVGDPIVLWGFGLALILNVVIGAQMWAYWGKEAVVLKKEKMEEAPAVWEKERIDSIPARAASPASPMLSGNRKWARKVD